jgi:hypothetical protein
MHERSTEAQELAGTHRMTWPKIADRSIDVPRYHILE